MGMKKDDICQGWLVHVGVGGECMNACIRMKRVAGVVSLGTKQWLSSPVHVRLSSPVKVLAFEPSISISMAFEPSTRIRVAFEPSARMAFRPSEVWLSSPVPVSGWLSSPVHVWLSCLVKFRLTSPVPVCWRAQCKYGFRAQYPYQGGFRAQYPYQGGFRAQYPYQGGFRAQCTYGFHA